MRTQGLGALAPQPVGPSDQLGKEQTLPDAEDPFSWYRFALWQTDSTPQEGTCAVGVELLEYVQKPDGGPTETVSEASGANGSCSGSHASGAASYETAQIWLHGQVPRWTWQHGTHRVQDTPACHQTFTPWSDLAFL